MQSNPRPGSVASPVVEPPAADLGRNAAGELDNAVMEGADVASENCIPTGLNTLFDRIDQCIRPKSALIAVGLPRSSAMVPQTFSIFECELRTGGRVTEIDLVVRAKELKVLEDYEKPVPIWGSYPRG
jgi:hypothetical protein